jgi:type I restriction enzyme S subunit
MSFPRYPKYKASGAEWLGDVPEGWGVVQYKQFVDIQNGSDHKDIEQPEGYPVFGSGGVFAYASKFLYDGESVLLGRKGTIDKPLYVTGRFWTVDTMYWTKMRPNTSGRFVYYLATTIPFNYYSTNTALPSMTKGALSRHLVPLPPLPEQTAIAEFLDRETGKIDGLVAEQRRLMELLKEKRQAVISHAVTKGLNPHAPMKPSGIEWLGDVPAGWEVRKVSQLFRAGKGKNGQMLTKEFCGANEGEYPVYSGQTENEGVMGTWDQFEFDFGEAGVLFSTTVGAKAMHLKQLFGRFSLSQNCMIIWTTSTLCITRFFYYHFQPLFQWQRSMIPDHMQPSFRMEDLYACAIALPPTDEQSAIVAFLDSELLKFDTLTAEAQRAIDLLQERRTALISAAVTGQIDVRQPPKN